jgi:hypothetical protein
MSLIHHVLLPQVPSSARAMLKLLTCIASQLNGTVTSLQQASNALVESTTGTFIMLWLDL